MPELKHTFTGGKMDKDNDERIIANGQYREALNIQVATSEGSDVGAAQNILGNLKQTSAISGLNNKYASNNYHIAHIVDPSEDSVYRFVHTPAEDVGIWMDRIVEFNTQGRGDGNGTIFDSKYNERAVVVDIYKVRTICSSFHQTVCDSEVFLEFSINAYQLRWGMKIDRIEGTLTSNGISVDIDANDWGVYIESTEIINPGTLSSPALIRCKLNVGFSDFELDPISGMRTNSQIMESDFAGLNITFRADRTLNFSNERSITGINIIDGMLFWTDNYSEPKKINIERSKKGSTYQDWDTWRDTRLREMPSKFDWGDFDQHTRLIVKDQNPTDCCINSNLNCIPV